MGKIKPNHIANTFRRHCGKPLARRSEPKREIEEETLTVAIVNEVIEGVTIAVVGELVVGSRKLLEALKGDGIEVATEFSVIGKNHSSSRNKGVDQRLLVLPHRLAMLILAWDFKERSGNSFVRLMLWPFLTYTLLLSRCCFL